MAKKKPRWTEKEIVLIVFFRSRGVSLAGCKNLLEFKFPNLHKMPRTLDAVSQKLEKLSQKQNLMRDNKQWSQEATDSYIASINPAEIDHILDFGPQELEIVREVTTTSIPRAYADLSTKTQSRFPAIDALSPYNPNQGNVEEVSGLPETSSANNNEQEL